MPPATRNERTPHAAGVSGCLLDCGVLGQPVSTPPIVASFQPNGLQVVAACFVLLPELLPLGRLTDFLIG